VAVPADPRRRTEARPASVPRYSHAAAAPAALTKGASSAPAKAGDGERVGGIDLPGAGGGPDARGTGRTPRPDSGAAGPDCLNGGDSKSGDGGDGKSGDGGDSRSGGGGDGRSGVGEGRSGKGKSDGKSGCESEEMRGGVGDADSDGNSDSEGGWGVASNERPRRGPKGRYVV
jgi:hypothetical protein